ncbi:DUF72 domain-containing protein [Candidatus Bathyarchaeota archaeon]|nr:DUF72 domain-containing protein [Candidatus Bathyarchaeota archaeon]NIR15652.1 DUF72 domain-containing protein [Desulfobacterales bacterium]NIU80877.1 DUF72 domain-containing protein [Candidatus Bathyarchaeota archaeon]NIV67522.1 DUF72 domain-containing protein [Candidatus Bathyarchaeota archaeon]NIW16040.1 DUF72 domain-containing protein [Candidatus Bathyarchaeota archaeon]
MADIRLGTCGWSYRDWVGPVYGSKKESKLKAYSKIFKTVEIDSTFYRYPAKGTVMGWTRYSPEGFKFSAKLSRLITHQKMLNLEEGVEEDLERFCELIQPLQLNGKLACLLIQLPPKYEYDLDHLESFLEILPSQFRFAIEFRDLSWMREETWRLLKRYRVAYTIVDEPLLPPELHITSDLAYFRWHGRGSRPWYNYLYDKEELKPWIPRVEKVAEEVDTVVGYFNNHYHGYAVENCLQVLEMLGTLSEGQEKAQKTVEEYFQRRSREMKQKPTTLEAFVEARELNLQQLLQSFMDHRRLKRAKGIKDDELQIQDVSQDRIKALIRDYHILIDLKNRAILHDCADWSRVLPSKKFCKHVGKLLLSLDMEVAVKFLRQIYANKNLWQFKPYTD